MIWAYARTRRVTAASFRAHLEESGIAVSESQVERWMSGRDHTPVDVAFLLAEHASGGVQVVASRLLETLTPAAPTLRAA